MTVKRRLLSPAAVYGDQEVGKRDFAVIDQAIRQSTRHRLPTIAKELLSADLGSIKRLGNEAGWDVELKHDPTGGGSYYEFSPIFTPA